MAVIAVRDEHFNCLGSSPMSRREEFLEKALEFHREYKDATSDIKAMMRENRAVGPVWDIAVAPQPLMHGWSCLLSTETSMQTISFPQSPSIPDHGHLTEIGYI
jgi:hypothetical protein